MTKQQEAVLQKIENKQYHLALEAIRELTPNERKHGRILIAKADAEYELGRDIDALRSYSKYLEVYPDGGGRDFALFGIAMSLKNLDLQQEAGPVLSLVSPSHVGLQKELDHSRNVLARQEEARGIVQVILEDLQKSG
jgi:hypothetical protein